MNYKNNIQNSLLNIYDYIDPLNEELYIPTNELTNLLTKHMIGKSLARLALRTRSKVVKALVCEAIGYPIPKSFRKTQPRFPGQNFDVYTQKSLNVQIWNEEIDANRRYVFFQVDTSDIISSVKIITGDELVIYDRTGTLTQKYQATMSHLKHNYCSPSDSNNINNWVIDNEKQIISDNPNSIPTPNSLLSISEIYNRLLQLVGTSIQYINATQERNRGAGLHEMICKSLGYQSYEDDGSYPDIKNQLIEVKLQTSPTIDLGLHSPEDEELILTSNDSDNHPFYSQDIRYVIFDAEVDGASVILNKLYVVSGEEFTSIFPLFQGKGINAKIQLPLPANFFLD